MTADAARYNDRQRRRYDELRTDEAAEKQGTPQLSGRSGN